MVLEAEVSSMVGERLPPHKKGRVVRHNKDHQKMMVEGEEPPYEMAKVAAEVEELPIIAINAISWDIDHSSIQIMKKPNTEAHI